MVGNVYGLFFFVFGISGLINVIAISFSYDELTDISWNSQLSRKENFKDQLTQLYFTRYKHDPNCLRELYKRSYKPINKRCRFPPNRRSRISKLIFSKLPELEANTDKTPISIEPYFSSKYAIYSAQYDDNKIPGGVTERHITKEQQKLFEYMGGTLSDMSENPVQSKADFGTDTSISPSIDLNFQKNLQLTDKKMSPLLKASSESYAGAIISNIPISVGSSETETTIYNSGVIFSISEDKFPSSGSENIQLVNQQGILSTQTVDIFPKDDIVTNNSVLNNTEPFSENEVDEITSNLGAYIFPNTLQTERSFSNMIGDLTNGPVMPTFSPSISHGITSETKGTSETAILYSESTYSKEIHPAIDEKLMTESTISQNSSASTSKDISLETVKEILSTNKQVLKTGLIITLNPSSSSTENTPLISSSSTKTLSTTDQDLMKKSTISQNSVSFSTSTSSGIKSNSVTAIQSTNSQTLGNESTSIQTSISLTINKAILIPSTSKITNVKDIYTTESTISKTHLISKIIPPDHVIEISSIKTARVIISAIFLVIALTAITVLAVYIFRVQRRGVQYDQLLLIP